MKAMTRIALTMVLALAVSAAGWSARHFALAKSMPEADSSVTSPENLQLWFTQVPQDGSYTVRLLDAAGELVETGDATRNEEDAKLIEVTVGRALSAGAYTVAWRGIGDDGHVVRDDFGFTVTEER